MALVWPGLVVEENNLTVQISALRKLLGADAIATVTARGYRFVQPEIQMPGAGMRTDFTPAPVSPTAIAANHAAPATAAPNPLAAPPVSLVADASPPLPEKPSIVILPFVNISGDVLQSYFSDGLTEDITTELSRFRSLFVIARNSAFTYQGRAVDVRQVGHELGVRYVLEGSARRAGARARVNAQLIDALT